jgi:hypothetical protein
VFFSKSSLSQFFARIAGQYVSVTRSDALKTRCFCESGVVKEKTLPFVRCCLQSEKLPILFLQIVLGAEFSSDFVNDGSQTRGFIAGRVDDSMPSVDGMLIHPNEYLTSQPLFNPVG